MYPSHALTSLSPDEIKAFVVEQLKKALPGLELLPRQGEPYRLTLSHPEAGDLVLNLGNLVHELRAASPGEARRMVDSFVTLAQRAVAPPAISLKSVYPGLRHRAFLDAAGQNTSDRMIGEGPGDLVSVVFSDQGEGVATLNENAVRSAGYAPEEVLMAAERNFVDLLPNAFCVVTPADGVLSLGLRTHPWLGTSLLFVPYLISRVMQERGWEQALLAAPTRETVDIVDASAPAAAKTMERWMQENLAGPRTQSEVVHSLLRDDTDYRKTHLMVGSELVRLN